MKPLAVAGVAKGEELDFTLALRWTSAMIRYWTLTSSAAFWARISSRS